MINKHFNSVHRKHQNLINLNKIKTFCSTARCDGISFLKKKYVLYYAIQFKINFFFLFIVIFLLYINGSVKRRKCLFLTVSGRHVTIGIVNGGNVL